MGIGSLGRSGVLLAVLLTDPFSPSDFEGRSALTQLRVPKGTYVGSRDDGRPAVNRRIDTASIVEVEEVAVKP